MLVQARDHRKRRSNLLSADNTQRDFALLPNSDSKSVDLEVFPLWQSTLSRDLPLVAATAISEHQTVAGFIFRLVGVDPENRGKGCSPLRTEKSSQYCVGTRVQFPAAPLVWGSLWFRKRHSEPF